MENLSALLEKRLSKRMSEIIDIGKSFRFAKTDDSAFLIFIRDIKITIEAYNIAISSQTFGPELIHIRDFQAIQLRLQDFRARPCPELRPQEETPCVDKCLYIIQTIDGNYHYGSSVIHDPLYLNWHASTTR